MLVASAIIFKAIIDIEKTKAWFGQIAGVLSPFIFGALLAYILNPMVRVFYHGMELLSKKFKFRLNKAVHKILAILITYVIVLGFAVLILVYILPEVMNNIVDFVNFIPGAYSSLLKLRSSRISTSKRSPNRSPMRSRTSSQRFVILLQTWFLPFIRSPCGSQTGSSTC